MAETIVVSTCNRVEVYADVDRFHGGGDRGHRPARAGTPASRSSELAPHLYVHYEDRAVQHLFSVACGLDSMVVGEGADPRPGPRRRSGSAQEEGTGGPRAQRAHPAGAAGRQARAHRDRHRPGRAPRSSASASTLAERAVGPIAGRRALVIGAGSMSALAAATLARAGVTDIVVANRTFERGRRLAERSAAGRCELGAVAGELGRADLVISCTGARHLVITADMVEAAMRDRRRRCSCSTSRCRTTSTPRCGGCPA